MKLFLTLALIQLSSCINISPVPNFSFKLPSENAKVSKTRSTYFGYSINLRKSSIMIGAPRSNSTVFGQKTVDEPGVIFKCNLDTDQVCYSYNFDVKGNYDKHEKYDLRKKDYQMLGAVISGGSSESDPLVVCAPNFRAVECNTNPCKQTNETGHFVNGICFTVDQTNSNEPVNVRQLSPLSQRNKQFEDKNKEIYLYHNGMSGFSAGISENNEIIIGCPGVLFFSGSFTRYQPRKSQPDILDTRRNDRTSTNNYFGYAVSSGMFRGMKKKVISYVASVPSRTMRPKDKYNRPGQKLHAYNGTAVIFDFKNPETLKHIQTIEVVSGSQFGEYFGYSLITEDFNNDGFADLAVSAPLYSKDSETESGAVYVFLNNGRENKVLFKFSLFYQL